MKKLDFIETWIANFIEKVGVSRILHLLVCGWIVTYGHVYGTDGGEYATYLAIFLLFLKEFVIDKKYDLGDIMWGCFGIILAWLAYVPVDMLGLSRFLFP